MRIKEKDLLEFGFEHVVGDKFRKQIGNKIYHLYNGENNIMISTLNKDYGDVSFSKMVYNGPVKDMEDFKIVLKRFYII